MKIGFMVCKMVQRISLKFSYAERVGKECGQGKKIILKTMLQ